MAKECELTRDVPNAKPRLRWSDRYLLALKLAVALLLVLLVALLWLVHRNAQDEHRATLIADVLWLEQSIVFHAESTTGLLQQLADDLAPERNKRDLFRARCHYLLKNTSDLKQVLWLDESGRLVDSIPAQLISRLGYEGFRDDMHARAIDTARRMGKTVHSEIYQTASGAQYEIYTPVFEEGAFRGTLVSVLSLNALLRQQVPWWFAEKYQVRIVDGNGQALASKSRVGSQETAMSYSVPLDPPGYGAMLQVESYRSGSGMAQTLISILIVLLAAGMLFSLLAMRGHIQRRMAAEQALRSEHAFRKAMEDSLTVGMRARDREGLITYANPAFCRMVGFSEEELIRARPPMPYWAPEDMERTLLANQAVIEGRPPRDGFELRFMRKDGTRFDALIYEAPLIDSDGRHAGWMGSILDVTERNQAEELARRQQEKLQQTARLITMGEMASTLAHELNQPLSAIASYAAGCMNRLASGKTDEIDFRQAVDKIGIQAQRAGRIIRRVHDFVRKSEPQRAPCDLSAVIDDSIGFLEADARFRQTRIIREIAGNCPEVHADRVMIEQVMLNLMRNGIEAMSHVPPGDRLLRVTLRPVDAQVEIRVADHGCGLAPEIRDKLFTPFFSTKADGMGMGLMICRSILEFHHGRLMAYDHPEGGTEFVITLPVGPA